MSADNIKKLALVTGGAQGIGAGIVRALLTDGFDVAVADLQGPKEHADLDRFKMHFIQANIADARDREEIVDFCKDLASELSVLVNNAGISVKVRQDMLLGDEQSLDQLMKVNLNGPYFLTQSIAKWMISRISDYPKGQLPKIVNIASLTSYASASYMAEYALSKTAVSMMTKLYADRLSEFGISVYEIRPGIIKTKMTQPSKEKYDRFIEEGGLPLQRWGLPEDVGKAVLAIAKGLLPYSTGEVINVDGGFHLRTL